MRRLRISSAACNAMIDCATTNDLKTKTTNIGFPSELSYTEMKNIKLQREFVANYRYLKLPQATSNNQRNAFCLFVSNLFKLDKERGLIESSSLMDLHLHRLKYKSGQLDWSW